MIKKELTKIENSKKSSSNPNSNPSSLNSNSNSNLNLNSKKSSSSNPNSNPSSLNSNSNSNPNPNLNSNSSSLNSNVKWDFYATNEDIKMLPFSTQTAIKKTADYQAKYNPNKKKQSLNEIKERTTAKFPRNLQRKKMISVFQLYNTVKKKSNFLNNLNEKKEEIELYSYQINKLITLKLFTSLEIKQFLETQFFFSFCMEKIKFPE